MPRMGMVLGNPNTNREIAARLIYLKSNQNTKNSSLGNAPARFNGMSFQTPMIGRLDTATKCGGCGK
jgi:hypothetical protein